MYHANFSKTKKYNYAYMHFYICKKNVSDIHVSDIHVLSVLSILNFI